MGLRRRRRRPRAMGRDGDQLCVIQGSRKTEGGNEDDCVAASAPLERMDSEQAGFTVRGITSQDCHARDACQDVCSSEWPFRARDGRAASSDDDDASTDRYDSHKRGLTSAHTTLHACGMYDCTRTCTSHPTLSSTLMATSTSPPFVRAWSWPSACC